MFQVRFFVEVEALGTFNDDAGGKETAEMAYLSAFDALRSSIQDAASKAYARERRNSYTLTASGFR
jgi:hypothetical protein